MSAVSEAAVALETALKTVSGIRVYRDPATSLDPPAAILGPPSLFWDALIPEPTRAVFQVWVVSQADDRMLERLWDLVPAVADAVATDDRAAVGTAGATASTWTAGGVDLPAYIVSVEVAL